MIDEHETGQAPSTFPNRTFKSKRKTHLVFRNIKSYIFDSMPAGTCQSVQTFFFILFIFYFQDKSKFSFSFFFFEFRSVTGCVSCQACIYGRLISSVSVLRVYLSRLAWRSFILLLSQTPPTRFFSSPIRSGTGINGLYNLNMSLCICGFLILFLDSFSLSSSSSFKRIF